VLAIMDGRYAASSEDIRRIAPPVLRHRLIRTFEAEADGIDADHIIEGLLQRVPLDPDHPEDLAVMPMKERA
jgi:MoxR-like ATPase